jgi:hypothetical protein
VEPRSLRTEVEPTPVAERRGSESEYPEPEMGPAEGFSGKTWGGEDVEGILWGSSTNCDRHLLHDLVNEYVSA